MQTQLEEVTVSSLMDASIQHHYICQIAANRIRLFVQALPKSVVGTALAAAQVNS